MAAEEPSSSPESPVMLGDSALIAGIRRCEQVSRAALIEQLALIAEAEHRGLAQQCGARSMRVWLRELLNIAEEDAKSRIVVARQVKEKTAITGVAMPANLPNTAAALRAGAITVAHARVIVDGVAALPPCAGEADRGRAEAMLAEQAVTLSPRQVRVAAERIRYYFDQDGALRDEEHQIDTRELHLAAARDGMTVIKGKLDREAGAKLRAALEPLAAPRPAEDGTPDPRTAGKRNADALADLLHLALSSDRLPTSGGVRPRIAVTIDYDTLRQSLEAETPRAGGTLETTGQPITAATVRRIACDADILPILLDGQSVPLDVGRSKRTAPPHLRAALLARDGPCAFPGCDRPPGTPEAHHIHSWIDGGTTNLHNMIMLCGHHHRSVHRDNWEIELHHGHPMFVPPAWIDPHQTPRPGNRAPHREQLTLVR